MQMYMTYGSASRFPHVVSNIEPAGLMKLLQNIKKIFRKACYSLFFQAGKLPQVQNVPSWEDDDMPWIVRIEVYRANE